MLDDFGDFVGKIGFSQFPINSFRLKNMEQAHSYIEIENMKAICSDLPFSLNAGVRETLAWMNNVE